MIDPSHFIIPIMIFVSGAIMLVGASIMLRQDKQLLQAALTRPTAASSLSVKRTWLS